MKLCLKDKEVKEEEKLEFYLEEKDGSIVLRCTDGIHDWGVIAVTEKGIRRLGICDCGLPTDPDGCIAFYKYY